MGEKIINSIIASIVGCISAIGMVWYLTEKPADFTVTMNGNVIPNQEINRHEITADTIRINQSLKIVDNKGEVLVEYKDGALFVKKEIVTENISTNVITSNRVKITNGKSLDEEAPVFGEIAALETGGAYMALLSPQGTHSMNIGFDKKETGFILSQNNEDNSIVAQAIMPKPNTKVTQKPNAVPAANIPAEVPGTPAPVTKNTIDPPGRAAVSQQAPQQTPPMAPQQAPQPIGPAGTIPQNMQSGISNQNPVSVPIPAPAPTPGTMAGSYQNPNSIPNPQLPIPSPARLSAAPGSLPQNY